MQIFFFLLIFGAPLFFTCLVACLLARVYAPLSDFWNLLQLVFYVIVALLLSFLLALVAGTFLAGIFWPLLRPLYKARCAKNGAPFQVGDHVRILAGRHKDRVVKVYDTWSGDSVRVDLGENERKDFKDIFDPIQLLRETMAPEPASNSMPPREADGP